MVCSIQVMNKRKILCYGAGDCFKVYHKLIDYEKNVILAVLDKSPPADGKFPYPVTCPNDVKIVTPDKVLDYEFDYIVLFSYNNAVEMRDILLSYHVSEEKILFIDVHDLITPNYRKINDLFIQKWNMYVIRDNQHSLNEIQMADFERVSRHDYVRTTTWELVANQIHQHCVNGDIAELGVFRGFTSSLLSSLLPERNIFLFDTFESFDDRDMLASHLNARIAEDKSYFLYEELKDTSVDYVLSQMPFPEKCIVKKGYFPETAQGISPDPIFCLVSIDTDLYAPTYEGLKWFYPRMASGGYIIVHDYGTTDCTGIKKAVEQFREEYGVTPVPLADMWGSIVIVKQ